jgi:hypothetical protein
VSSSTVRMILASDVANGGTFTLGYPIGTSAGTFEMGTFHKILSNTYGTMRAGVQVAFAFGASSITITNNTGSTLVAGSELYVELDRMGAVNTGVMANSLTMTEMAAVLVQIGAPIAAAANNIVASQAATAASGLATGINGAIASNGSATLDVPRNVVASWTNTAVLTVTGFDEYGQPMRQSSASGTSLTGTKAFKRVTGISVSADVTGLTVGTGDVFGLPFFLPETGLVFREMQDGAAVGTAGTFVKGVETAATATSGDVRGTYDPNAAADGSRKFTLLIATDNPSYTGVKQFA